MPKNDYVHAIYVVGIILFFAPMVHSLLFNFFMSGAPDYRAWTQGSFYTMALFQTTAFMMLLYVAYKRFIEGYKDGRKDDQAKSPE